LSEENKTRCPKCDIGKLRQLEFCATESDGRKRHTPNTKMCQLCNTIVSYDLEISFHQVVDANNGIQFH